MVLTAREMKPEPHPLPALLLAPFFARSLTLVPHSLLLNHTETPATQARSASLHNNEITEFVICGRKYYVFCFPYSGIFISPFLALLNAVSDCHLLNSYAFCYVSANLIMFSLRLGVFIATTI